MPKQRQSLAARKVRYRHAQQRAERTSRLRQQHLRALAEVVHPRGSFAELAGALDYAPAGRLRDEEADWATTALDAPGSAATAASSLRRMRRANALATVVA
jgi:hypothetical protein